MPTNIEWTDETDNIIVVEGGGWWCRMCSEGCANCYAARLNQSDYFKGNHLPYTGEPPKLILKRDLLASWARQTKPRRHFVASMTDVFGDWVPFEWCVEFLDAMTAAPRQTFQVLTKRANLMRIAVNAWLELRGLKRVPPNIWLGVSVETQMWALKRIPDLLGIPCTRFLSCEPLLEAVDIEPFVHFSPRSKVCPKCLFGTNGEDDLFCPNDGTALGPDPRIDWVILGGESGPGARPSNLLWHESLVLQCTSAGVPVFVKQMGANVTHGNDVPLDPPFKHHKGGDPNEWPETLCVREFPKVEVPA